MQKLAFGMKNLPIINNNTKNIDTKQLTQMIDEFMENNFNCFEVSYTYHNHSAENIIADILHKNYDHNEFKIIDKLPIMSFKDNNQINEFFNMQLKNTSLEYFDYYQIPDLYMINTKDDNLNILDFLNEKKDSGKIEKIGLSSYMGYQNLDEILDNNTTFDYVQLELNYLDMNNPILQSQKCFNVALKHEIPVFATEPLKNGLLLNIPEDAKKLIKDKTGDTPLTWAFRYLITMKDIYYIISNMNNLKQLKENMEIFKTIKPLNKDELKLTNQIIKLIQTNSLSTIPGCTLSCSSCTLNCPNAQR